MRTEHTHTTPVSRQGEGMTETHLRGFLCGPELLHRSCQLALPLLHAHQPLVDSQRRYLLLGLLQLQSVAYSDTQR